MQSVERALSDESREDEPDESEFMPVGQAAKAFGVSAMTVRRLYDSDKLPGYRHGRTRLIFRPFVDGFMAEVKTGRQPVLLEYSAQWFARARECAA